MKKKERIENIEKQVKELYSLLQQEQPIKDEAYYEQFVGRKVRGFEFKHDVICYLNEMKDYEGKLGVILRYGKNVNSYYVKFKDARYSYPADMVIERLEPEEPKEETFEVGQPVWVWNNNKKEFAYFSFKNDGIDEYIYKVCFNHLYAKDTWESSYKNIKKFIGIDPNTGIEWN